MPKVVPPLPAAKLVLPESFVAEIDQLLAKMNTPEDRAARAALFGASSTELGRAALKARQSAAGSKAP